MNKIYTKEEEKAWKNYDSSFIDPMDEMVVAGTSEKPDFDSLDKDPIQKNTGVSYGASFEFSRVGNGDQTESRCGTFRHSLSCLEVHLHDHTDMKGNNHKGKVPVKKVFYSCHKPSCPVCFKRGYAVREASAIDHALKLASFGYLDAKGVRHQGLGLIEHSVCSVPACDYGLSF